MDDIVSTLNPKLPSIADELLYRIKDTTAEGASEGALKNTAGYGAIGTLLGGGLGALSSKKNKGRNSALGALLGGGTGALLGAYNGAGQGALDQINSAREPRALKELLNFIIHRQFTNYLNKSKEF